MDCRNGVLFSDKNYTLQYNVNRISKQNNVFVAMSKDYDDFFVKIIEYKPHFIIIDMDTIELPYGMLKAIANRKIFKVESVFIFSSKIKYEVDGARDINYSTLSRILEKSDNVTLVDLSQDEKMSERINKLLLGYGFSTKHLGFTYIKDLLISVLQDNACFKSFNSMLYPKVACRFSTTNSCVERNIRNAICFAYKNNKEGLSALFLKDKIPSVREVLFFFIDKLKIKHDA